MSSRCRCVWSAPSAFTVQRGGRDITCEADTHGFDAIRNICDPTDDDHHGTRFSWTIGAVGNNGVGAVELNWTTRIMALKFLDAFGSGTAADAIKAIDFAIQVKAIFGGAANVRGSLTAGGAISRKRSWTNQGVGRGP